MTNQTLKIKNSRKLIVILFLSLIFLCCSAVYAQEKNKSTIKITVNGLKTDEGVVRIAIYDSEEGWFKKAVYSGTVKIKNNKCEWTIENVPYGDYVAFVYQDKNSSGAMDMNDQGPIEPFGYSNVTKMIMGPARWNDTKFSITSPKMEIEVMVLEKPPAFPDSMKQNVTFKDRIDVGGYKLNICCFGKGKPAVIIEAGAGCPTVETGGSWRAVIPAIAPTTQVCLYDRAGLGLSDRAPEQDLSGRTSQDMVKDLHTLLDKAGIPAPYILVGHSIGGYNVRLYASQYPEEVAGMVLVDSTHPDTWSKFSAALPPEQPDEPESLRDARSVADPQDPDDPEKMDVVTSAAQVRATGLLGDLPLVVLTHTPGIKNPNLQTDLSDKLDRVWQDLQIDLAGLSSNSTHIIAAHAGHFIQVDEPQLVIDAILKVMDQMKK